MFITLFTTIVNNNKVTQSSQSKVRSFIGCGAGRKILHKY